MLVRAGGRAHAARPSPAAHRSGGRVAAPIPPLPLRCERHARSSCGVAVARGETSGSIDSGINSGIDNSVDRNVSSSNTSTSSSISNAGSTFHNEQQHAQHQHQQHQQHQHQQHHQQQPHHAAATTTSRRRVLQTAAAAVAAAAVAAAAPLAAPRAARAEAAILVGPPESGAKFATISEAIAAAESGATITVLPGRYEERLIIEGKFLTIQSAQAKSVEVVWESQRPYEHTVECKATGGATTLRGLALRHYSKSVAQNYCVLAQAGAVLVMDSCDVRSNSGVGVGVEGAMLQLLDSAVHDCARHGVAAFGGFEGACGGWRLGGGRRGLAGKRAHTHTTTTAAAAG